MGVVKLKKAALYYHKSVKDDVAKILQRSGVCQVIEPAENLESGRGPRPDGTEDNLRACEEQQAHIRYLFRALGGRYADPVSSLDRMMGEKTPLPFSELSKTARETDLEKLAASVKNSEAELNELRIEAGQLTVNASILSKIKDLPYSLNILGEGTSTLKGVLGTLPALQKTQKAQGGGLAEALKAWASDTDLFVAQAAPKEKELWAVVVYSRAREQEILDLCTQNGMSFADLPASLTGTVTEESAKIAERLVQCREREAAILKSMDDTAAKWMPVVQKVSDYWDVMRGRYSALASSDATVSTVRTIFWVPADALPALRKQIEEAAPGVEFEVSDPSKDDKPPTLLKNSMFSGPAEALTLLYSPPLYGKRDPTSVMAPFFFLFFGMCLGDAGYALIMMGFMSMLFKKYRKMPKDVQTFLRLFFGAAVATFLYGIFTGGIFGDLIDVCPFIAFLKPLKDALVIADPMKDPMTILGLSLFLGVVQLMFGLAVAAFDDFRAGNFADAIGNKVSWILFVVGLLVFGGGSAASLPPSVAEGGKWTALAGAALIFWYAGKDTKNIFMKVGAGLYALYGSTAYLGDILSYCRLLALGLGGGVIGSVINMLAAMIAGVPVVGWLLAAIIVVGGHLFSLAINLLGAFVHAMRLQFVEYFGKFYTGNGTSFRPFRLQTQYVEVLED